MLRVAILMSGSESSFLSLKMIYSQSPSVKKRRDGAGMGAGKKEPRDKMSQGLLGSVELFLRGGTLLGIRWKFSEDAYQFIMEK